MGRVALLADFLAERWPSMDLVADMYAASLPRAFASAGPRMEIDLLRPELKRRTSRLHPAGWNFDRLINRLFDYPLYARARRREYDLLHIVDHSYSQLVHALPAARTVVTCHDLDTFRCLWEPGHAGRGPLFLAMTRRILAGLRKAAHVCCDSVATHDELLARALVPAQRATVVPLGVRPEFLREPGPEASAKVAGLLRAPGLDDTQSIDVLHIGSTIARKRIDLLLEIFASLRNAEPRLRLLRVGGAVHRLATSAGRTLGTCRFNTRHYPSFPSRSWEPFTGTPRWCSCRPMPRASAFPWSKPWLAGPP